MTDRPDSRIEILSVDILDEKRALVEELKSFARSLKIEFGWHYLLDITWILANLEEIEGKYIMDAGAGTGLIQWYLAGKGARVLSIDRLNRSNLPLRFRNRFNVKGKRPQDLNPVSEAIKQKPGGAGPGTPSNSILARTARKARDLLDLAEYSTRASLSSATDRSGNGTVLIYNQDLTDLADIEDGTLDAVVSVSALEHNSPDILTSVIHEIMRVLKPGAPLLATLGASRDIDWHHAPSDGWCFSLESLQRIFVIADDIPSNFEQYDILLDQLRNCEELSQNLAGFYFKSGNNGMPWGKWNPQYQPAGIYKVKPRN